MLWKLARFLPYRLIIWFYRQNAVLERLAYDKLGPDISLGEYQVWLAVYSTAAARKSKWLTVLESKQNAHL